MLNCSASNKNQIIHKNKKIRNILKTQENLFLKIFIVGQNCRSLHVNHPLYSFS